MQCLALGCRLFSATRTRLLITGNGTDRLGIVRDLSALIWARQGNILESTMARLAGEFVVLMLADVPVDKAAELPFDLAGNKDLKGLNLTVRPASENQSPVASGDEWQLEVQGADHPGVLHALADVLCRHDISITDLTTCFEQAPLGGALLFRMHGCVRVPTHVDAEKVRAELSQASSALDVDTQFVAK